MGHAQSNGMVERRQNTIISFLRKNTNTVADQNSWDDKLPTLITISTTSASRKQSPFFLTFLQHPRFPYSSILADRPNYKEDSLIAHKLNMQQRVIKQVEKFFHSAFLESKAQFDKKVQLGNSLWDVRFSCSLLREDSSARSSINLTKVPTSV